MTHNLSLKIWSILPSNKLSDKTPEFEGVLHLFRGSQVSQSIHLGIVKLYQIKNGLFSDKVIHISSNIR